MKRSKLHKVLSTFSVVELNRIEKLVSSPYFNSDNRLISLFQYMLHLVKQPGLKIEDMNPQNIWNASFPNTPFDDKTFRNLNSKLLGLIETYLIQEQLKENPIDEANLLLKAIDEKNSKTLENIAVSRAKKLIKVYPFKSSQHFYERYRMERQLYSLNKVEVSRIGRGKNNNINIDEILKNLDLFYYGERLKYQCSLLGWQKLITTDLAVEDLDSIIEQILRNDVYKKPHILIYLYIYRTLVNPDDEESFNKLIETIDSSIDMFPQKEAKYIMDSANNFCLRKINSGDTTYLQKLFQLYKTSVRNRVLIIDNEISPWAFKNIVGISLRVKEFQWAKNFIEKFSSNIPSDYRESISSLSLAQLSYYMKDYDKVLIELQKVDFREFSLKVNAELTLAATYYELDEITILMDQLTSFSKFLRRQRSKVNPTQLDYCRNFIQGVKEIVRKHNNPDELRKIREQFKNTKNIASKSWLLEKVDELLGEKV